MLRCAIVGVGRWGQRLVDSCQQKGQPQSDKIRFTHAVARSPEKHADYCAAQQLQIHSDYQEVLNDDAIDAVVLATPHSQHFEQISAAADAGKHVFVEKPLTMRHDHAVMAADNASAANIVLAVGYNRRFLPAMQALKAMIDDGALGTITHMEGNFSGPFGLHYDKTMWRASTEESPAGGMTAMGIHIVDAFIWLGGPIAEVRAQRLGHILDVEMDDTTSVMLGFENGVSGMLSTLCATARQFRVQVFGTLGWAQLRDHHVFDTCALEQQQAETKNYAEVDIEFAELLAFADACQNKQPFLVTVEEAVHGIAVQDAIINSAQNSASLQTVCRHENWYPNLRNEKHFPSLNPASKTQ